ncbi:MAG: efflux RND transporter periplasmic adaptor subunit [Gemmataceae bacterium]
MNPNRPQSLFARLLRLAMTGITMILALAGLALFLAWMGGAFHDKVKPGTIPLERSPVGDRPVVTANKTREMETIVVVGTVQPRRKTDVASQILSTIREIKPRPGDRVKAGDVLIVLDDRELMAQQREASATLASAEADLVTRKSDVDRLKATRGTGSVSAEEINRIEGAYRVTEALVRRAKETMGRIDVQLSYTKITATADGLVSDRFAEPGDLASPGKSLLTLYDPSDLELQANAPESLASGLSVGQSLGVRIDANNQSFAARIREIVPQAQQASRSVLIKLGLPLFPGSPVLPGMFGRTAIPVGQMERITIPSAAVRKIGQLDLVDVVDSDGLISRRFVRIGTESDGNVEIRSGLAAGERVALPSQK